MDKKALAALLEEIATEIVSTTGCDEQAARGLVGLAIGQGRSRIVQAAASLNIFGGTPTPPAVSDEGDEG